MNDRFAEVEQERELAGLHERFEALRLMPSEQLSNQLAGDYKDMQPVFFSRPPPFQHILDLLPALENRINEHGQ